jgi:hypothetical protein
MNSFITFDVTPEEGRIAFISAMQAKGYFIKWTSSDKTYYLPQNTLYKADNSLQQALTDAQKTIETLKLTPALISIQLLRCIILPVVPWEGIEGVAQ